MSKKICSEENSIDKPLNVYDIVANNPINMNNNKNGQKANKNNKNKRNQLVMCMCCAFKVNNKDKKAYCISCGMAFHLKCAQKEKNFKKNEPENYVCYSCSN